MLSQERSLSLELGVRFGVLQTEFINTETQRLQRGEGGEVFADGPWSQGHDCAENDVVLFIAKFRW